MKLFIAIILPFFFLTSSVQTEKSEMLCKKWEYVNSIDPYQGGIEYAADLENPKYLIFHANGNFEEIDQWNHWKGKWTLNSDESKIGILINEHNGTVMQNSGQFSFRRNLSSLSESELTFWIQGRHGAVSYKYKAVNKNEAHQE